MSEDVGSFEPRQVDHMQLIVLPTEQCNFRCTYCYESFVLREMPPEVWLGLERLILARMPELSHFTLSWFGGEPMLALDRVVAFSNFASTLAQRHGVAFSGDMTTNGSMLTKKRLHALTSVGITHFQVSLDGPKSLHNKYRQSATRQETFTRIHQNLTRALKTDIEFQLTLRLHIHPDTGEHLRDIYQLLQSFDDDRVSLLVRSIANLGGPNSSSIAAPSRTHAQVTKDAIRDAATRAAPKANYQAAGDDGACYASLPTSWVIRADGRVSKCTVAFEDDRNTVGHLTQDGSMNLDIGMLKPWMRGLFSRKPDELRCPYIGLPNLNRSIPLEIPPMPPTRLVQNARN